MTNAQAVSRALTNAGHRPVATDAREGLRVKRDRLGGGAVVIAQYDTDYEAHHFAEKARNILADLGFTLDYAEGSYITYVTKG
jgi:hypothetical protein